MDEPATDDVFPSRGETPRQRAEKDRLRAKLTNEFMDALLTGDFREYQQADGALRKLLAEPKPKRLYDSTPEGVIENVRRLREQGYSHRQIAALLEIGKSTVQDILSERYHKAGDRVMLSVIIKRDGKEIAEFDTATSRLVLFTIAEPDSKVDIRKALSRALRAADDRPRDREED